MIYNWRQIGKRTWSHSFTFLRQPRDYMAMAGFSLSKNGRFFICGKSLDDNLYRYHVVLTMKAKDWRPRGFKRSVKEKLSYTAWRNVLPCILPCNPKHSTFLPQQLFCASPKKQSNCFGSIWFFPFYWGHLKAGTGHKMLSVPFIFSTSRFKGLA